jgi:hypothetical protein
VLKMPVRRRVVFGMVEVGWKWLRVGDHVELLAM